MSIEMYNEANGKILVIYLSGKLVKEDYAHFVPEVERAVRQHGKIRLLVRMHDFHGWTAGGMWEDMKFGLEHFSHFERVALVGEKRWEAGMAAFCKPFTKAQLRYFDIAKADEAIAWIHQGVVANIATPGSV